MGKALSILVVIIKFRDGIDWYKANWVFRQLAEDLKRAFPEDEDINREMQKAQAFGTLSIDALEGKIASRVLNAIKKVADETIRGKPLGWKQSKPEDVEGHKLYLEAIRELRALMNR